MPFLSALQDSVAPLFMFDKLLIFIKTRIANQGLAVFSVVFFGLKKTTKRRNITLIAFLKKSQKRLVCKNFND